MRWKIYTITLLISVTSCKSIQNLVDQGEYDEAIYVAAKRLHGKKNKKTKHVKGLEEAFSKVTQRDLTYINSLNARKYPERWDRVYDIAIKIDSRQHKVSPFLPLISKDGYVAQFNFADAYSIMEEASNKASAYHYDRASDLLKDIGFDNKEKAIEAFHELKKIDRYFRDYKEKQILMQKAHHHGTTRVMLESRNMTDLVMPLDLEDELLAVSIPSLNSFWTQFYTNSTNNAPMDYKAVIEIQELDVSPERESERIYRDSREVKDGYNYILDSNGNVAKDSLGNDLKEDKFTTVVAEVIELEREKAAYVKGSLKIIDLIGGQIIDHFPISAEAIFSSHAARFIGDQRALTNRSRNRLRASPDRFPTDEELIWQAAEQVKSIMASHLDGIRYFTS